ncbi:MAG TPA: TonB-dependent receptor [Bryobacteraceae bacterium]|nr:TonB-dependent receptor [Bryobacteraceae bacterium]
MLAPRFAAICAVLASAGWAQRNAGELRLTIEDPAGLRLKAAVELRASATSLRVAGKSSREGKYTADNLPFGRYLLRVEAPGFAPDLEAVEIRSEVPIEKTVRLGIAPAQSEVTVHGSPLIDTSQPSPASVIPQREIGERVTAQASRAVPDLVASQPGWILEANAVLHPRGSEYQTQFIVDGMPITENRSSAFGPSFDPSDIRSMDILTAGYPAEYGRKLGGVVQIDTAAANPGLHGEAELDGGSFATVEGSAAIGYAHRNDAILVSGSAGTTARYLDPPVQENYTNSGSDESSGVRYEHDFSDADRLRIAFRNSGVRFEVPNERVQQQNGQRQDRTSGETAGDVSWQHIVSPSILASLRASVRDVSADLWSNPLATPIDASQNRDYREEYAAATLAAHHGAHELKFGADGVFNQVDERFAYRITDPAFFDPGVPPAFNFGAHANGRQYSGFAQDLIRFDHWTFSAGLRYDAYHLLLNDSAWSPRLGVAWGAPHGGIVLRASYDRAFQTPAVENLLLASSPETQHITPQTTGLPVRPSRGDFFQAGFGKAFASHVRLESNWFLRSENQFADDDLFLNTGVSFPIAFARARVHGVETKLDVPQWGAFSGFINWSWMVGTAWLPITGGLFPDAGSAQLLTEHSSFPISQDQRNTVNARLRWQATKRVWTAASYSYGSGLPTELDQDVAYADLIAEYGAALIHRVNFDRGRLRPSVSLDLSAGVLLRDKERWSVRVQGDIVNVTNHVNLINFAGLFSGTAVAPPRSYTMRVATEF